MTTKTRSFSIYLLKEGQTGTNSLKEENSLAADVSAHDLPDGASLYVLDSERRQPWWKSYFGLEIDLYQENKGALVFIPVKKRFFALSFGHVAHNLIDSCYEYDFGLRVTLNSLDPQKLKSTDTLEPGAAKRQRTQLPIESELTFFDFDQESTILRSLTGKVRDEHQNLFKHATGSSSLRLSTDVDAEGLVTLCESLFNLYESDDYRKNFPEIQNISPVKDPLEINNLNGILLSAFRSRDSDLNLAVPDIVNYTDNLYISFSGAGAGSVVYDDVFIGRYFEYLDSRGVDINSITIDDLKKHALALTDEQGNVRQKFSIFKSLVFDAALSSVADETFHLNDGQWYRIDNNFISRMHRYLDPFFAECDLPHFDHESEGAYNAAVPGADASAICLDTKSIGPEGQTAVEPCDIISVRGDEAVLYYVKISTLSAQLSHLFNQGLNAIELIRLEQKSLDKLIDLINEYGVGRSPERIVNLLKSRTYRIVYAIVTRKDAQARSLNLPLFSRISLMRSMKAFQLMGVTSNIIFVQDLKVSSPGKKKPRKKRNAENDERRSLKV